MVRGDTPAPGHACPDPPGLNTLGGEQEGEGVHVHLERVWDQVDGSQLGERQEDGPDHPLCTQPARPQLPRLGAEMAVSRVPSP